MPQSITPHLERGFEEWEDTCRELGFEYVDFEAKGRNEFGEPVGVERAREALEANDWEAGSEEDDWGLDDFEGGVEDDLGDGVERDFGFEFGEEGLREDMRGMKMAIFGGGGDQDEDGEEQDGQGRVEDDEEVEKLQAMMLKMQAVRGESLSVCLAMLFTNSSDMGVDLPEAERKRFAAKAVNDLMKTL